MMMFRIFPKMAAVYRPVATRGRVNFVLIFVKKIVPILGILGYLIPSAGHLS